MNNIVNNFLLAEDRFKPGIHLRLPVFTYSASGPFTKNRERIHNKCFQHDMTHGDFKGFPRTAALINYYVIKHLILLGIQNMMDINVDFLQTYYANFL